MTLAGGQWERQDRILAEYWSLFRYIDKGEYWIAETPHGYALAGRYATRQAAEWSTRISDVRRVDLARLVCDGEDRPITAKEVAMEAAHHLIDTVLDAGAAIRDRSHD